MRATRRLVVLTTSGFLLLFACAERPRPTPSSSSTTSAARESQADQVSGPGSYGPLYDTSTVETLRGRVVGIEHLAPRRGVFVILRTESGETISVHLGPAWYIDEQEPTVGPGDVLEVSGSRVAFDGAPALIARRIVKGDDELVLRDEAGIPVWRTRRRGGPPPATVANSSPPRTTPEPSATNSDTSVLSETEKRALTDALEDEYRAWAIYDHVIRDFGPERPFINIREAEARHVEALRTLFVRYGIPMPENTWPGRVPRYASIREACEAAIEAEVANVALYDRLLQSTSRPDILAVFGNLQRASQENHLPAFRRCASRGAGRGPK